MNDNRYLPPRFKSWFSFYQEIKRFIRPGHDTVIWAETEVVLSEKGLLPVEEYAYSVRNIHKQTLDELIEFRELQTFSKDELDVLRAAMHHYAGYNRDERTVAVRQKVMTLFIEQLKKERR